MPSLLQSARRSVAAFLLTVCGALPSGASNEAATPSSVPASPKILHVYHALVPLGSEAFSFSRKNEREIFYVMVSARNHEFEGQQLCLDGGKHVLRTGGGLPVQSYPRELRFRVSVGERDGTLVTDPPTAVQTNADTFNELITGLKFEMRVFHALDRRVLRPTKVTHIGIPPEVPANTRIYEVTFDLGDVPISDRVVMHVLTGEGERLAKFNFDLY